MPKKLEENIQRKIVSRWFGQSVGWQKMAPSDLMISPKQGKNDTNGKTTKPKYDELHAAGNTQSLSAGPG